jgi:hypothetical protein
MSELTETEKEVFCVLKDRWIKGRKEYGEGINWHQTTIEGWIDNAIEEAADMLQYLVALKLKIRKESR